MLSELKMKLDIDDLNFRQSSNLQGVLMKQIDTKYAEYLHHNQYNPYSSAIYHDKGHCIWKVCTIGEDAYNNIIGPLRDADFNHFVIYNGNIKVKILDRVFKCEPASVLIDILNGKDLCNTFNIKFITPASFKSNKKYVFYPDIRLIFQSLINKYNYAINGEISMDIDELLDSICNSVQIRKYNLKSIAFPLEGTTVPGFMGELKISILRNSNVFNIINMLLYLAEYTGFGIKNSIGMGQVDVVKG